MASSTISNSETVPRSGIIRQKDRRRTEDIVDAGIIFQSFMPMVASPFAAEQTGRTENHHQQEQDEEEHLPEGRRDIVAAQRLHDADADAAEQRAFDAAHAAKYDDDEGDQDEIQTDRRKHREQRHHHAGGESRPAPTRIAKVMRNIRGTGIPISFAASPSCTVARTALPK